MTARRPPCGGRGLALLLLLLLAVAALAGVAGSRSAIPATAGVAGVAAGAIDGPPTGGATVLGGGPSAGAHPAHDRRAATAADRFDDLRARPAGDESADDRPGGDTTVDAEGRFAFSLSAANLSADEQARFAIGNSFFRRNWVVAPASTRARDGLGPLFNARSCSGCHVNDGRAAPGDAGLLLRVSVPGRDAHGGPLPEPHYGNRLATQAIPGVPAEGRVVIDEDALPGRFADGSGYRLHRPRYRIAASGYGPLDRRLATSPRIAPQLIGIGLLAAIADADIEANAAAQAVDAARGGAIRGQVNRVWDEPSRQLRVGRFGWKANAASVLQQTAVAFADDIGITSSLFPNANCMPAQRACQAAPSGGQPEIDDATLLQVAFYAATLAPPVRRSADDPAVRRGERLFMQAQCAACHRPAYVTAGAPAETTGRDAGAATGLDSADATTSPALAGQPIHPYTDLLLHDMGAGLADGRADFLANGRQWRTPPLWGIGLLEAVNGHQRLLHDGRARGVLEALLWHDGEARASRDAVIAMPAADRLALRRFVESL